MNTKISKIKLKVYLPYIIIILLVLFVDLLIWTFSPNSWSTGTEFNHYYLQAKAWLSGNLNISADYFLHEIALYNGKQYISFPPIPSVLILPFAIFGDMNGDLSNYLAFIMTTIGVIYAYKIAISLNVSKINSLLLTFILTIGSGFMYIMCNGAVWFMAQSFSFTFLVISLYYCITKEHKHTKWALLFYALSVGCRPLNALWIVFIIQLLWKYNKKFKILDFVPAACVAIFLMILNYARFGNIIEFGHSYLPEFDKTHEHFAGTQFGMEHLAKNLQTIFRMPYFEGGELNFHKFDGNFFIIPCAIYLVFIILSILGNRSGWRNSLVITAIITAIVHIVITCMHRTMGGWQWGHRYLIDMTPGIFLVSCYFIDNKKKWITYTLASILLVSFIVNLIGTVGVYNTQGNFDQTFPLLETFRRAVL